MNFRIHFLFYFNLQMNKNAKYADTLKTKGGDLKNNVFTAKIMLDNLRKDIEGLLSQKFVLFVVIIITLQYKYFQNNLFSQTPGTTSELNQYSNDNRRIEIKKALKTAKTILNYLKSVDIAKRTTEVENFLE